MEHRAQSSAQRLESFVVRTFTMTCEQIFSKFPQFEFCSPLTPHPLSSHSFTDCILTMRVQNSHAHGLPGFHLHCSGGLHQQLCMKADIQAGKERQWYLYYWLRLSSQLAALSFSVVRKQAQNCFAFVYLLTIYFCRCLSLWKKLVKFSLMEVSLWKLLCVLILVICHPELI